MQDSSFASEYAASPPLYTQKEGLSPGWSNGKAG